MFGIKSAIIKKNVVDPKDLNLLIIKVIIPNNILANFAYIQIIRKFVRL